MEKFKRNASKRIMAMLLVLLVVLGSVPLPVMTYATEAGNEVTNNAQLTIKVTGKESVDSEPASALTGAQVRYAVVTSEDELESETLIWFPISEKENESGTFVLAKDSIPITGDKQLYIKATCDGYVEQLSDSIAVNTLDNEKEISLELKLLSSEDGGEEIKNNESVTIKVTDALLCPLSNVKMQYIIDTAETAPNDTAYWKDVDGQTDEDGKLLVLSADTVDKDSGLLWVKVSCNGYKTEYTSIKLSELIEECVKTVELKEIVNANISISKADVATVVVNDEKISFTTDDSGTINGTVSIPKGEEVSYTITSNDGYYVKKVTIGESSEEITIENGKVYTNKFSASDTTNISIEMGEYYTVSVSEQTEGGTVKLNDGEESSLLVDENADVVLIVTPDSGYQISRVTISGVDQPISNRNEFKATLNTTSEIKIEFVKVYTLKVDYKVGETIEPGYATDGEKKVGSITINQEETGDVTLSVNAAQLEAEEYRILSVKINDELLNEFKEEDRDKNIATYSKSLTENCTIEATFALKEYGVGVEVNDSNYGSVNVKEIEDDSNSNGIIESGETVSVEIMTVDGYVIDTITVKDVNETANIEEVTDENGNVIKGKFSFEIENIQNDKEITVTFAKAKDADKNTYSIEQYLHSVDNTFIVTKDGEITFSTTNAGIRVFEKNVEEPKESDAEEKIKISVGAEVEKIQVYYKAEDEMSAGWHSVTSLSTDNPIKVVADTKPADITYTIDQEATNDYYSSDVTLNVTAEDKEAYSGIASIKYCVIVAEKVNDDTFNNVDWKELYSYLEPSDILSKVSPEEKINVDVINKNGEEVTYTEFNSKDTKVLIRVEDRAGNISNEVVPLKINAKAPEIALSFENDTRATNDVTRTDRYYTGRTLKIIVNDRYDTFSSTDVVAALNNEVITKNGDKFSIDAIEWDGEEDCEKDVHIGTYSFEDDGTYTIDTKKIEYTNKANISNKSVTTGGAENINAFVIDNEAPGAIKVAYLPESDTDTDMYYKDFVDVKISASDTTDYGSGIKTIEWRYVQAPDSSKINEESDDENGWTEINVDENNISYTEIIRIPRDYDTSSTDNKKQFNGYLIIQVTDWAGNTSTVLEDDGQTFIVDNKSPKNTQIIYTDPSVPNTTYYNEDIEFIFYINEANFYSEDVKVYISKDGADKVLVDAKNIEWDNKDWQDVDWAMLGEDEHVGKYTISGDGDYILYLEYMDRSGNSMVNNNDEECKYQSDVFTIDTTKPEINFEYKENQMIFTITERNFNPKDISLKEDSTLKENSIRDIKGSALSDFSVAKLEAILKEAEWKQEGEAHTCTLDQNKCPDGIYSFEINYTDIVEKTATCIISEKYKDGIIIDDTAPRDVTITYSEPSEKSFIEKIIDGILQIITFGYYQPSVTVTFTAYDDTSGVGSFTWSYKKEDDASDSNSATEGGIITADKIVQDKDDKSKFTATITLPDTDAKQLRGSFAVVASDNMTKANSSEKVTDLGNVIVVDSIAPIMTAEYSVANRIVGNTSYYNDKAEVTFTVTEANFYAEDVVVMVSKDGGTAYAVTPSWTDVNADTHVGTYTLSGDGDYVITVDYTDRSTNKMVTYVSNTITIDTIQPVVDVVYENKDVINTLTDRDGMERQYFAKTQTATVTITEHNFNAEDVVFNIKATDVTGKELDVNSLHTKSEWKAGDKADTYVCTITYPGDANYTFDVEYADLATNSIADYSPNYFTVDNTAPVDLKVSYSTGVLETVLEALSFGFYNAKTDVTITADDAVSGVQAFMYSYTKADGVSAVNAELINQAIAASEITYSADGKTATVYFQIPKDVLTNGNQFNGTISFEAIDRAGYKNTLSDNKRIVVDNIAPTASVTYNEPINREGTISYYDGNVNATVVITEANFYAQDVLVTVSRDGGASYGVTPSWVNNSVDIHTGTFTLSEDGDYFITISYRDKSSNEMVVYTSEQLTIDTDIQEPTITFNGNNEDRMAYKDEIVPEISFTDVNYDSFEIFLYRTSMDAIDVDITEEKGINNLFSITDETGSASLNIFDVGEDGKYDPNDDGIYRLLVTMQDKAGHTIEKEAYFTINRYGSVYAFNDYLVNLIADGGAYVNAVNEDLVITEYNADRLVSDSLNIDIMRDGKPLDSADYTVSPTISDGVSVGSSGWYQYEYVISKNNFGIDGIYKIYVSSTDATGNNPENSNFEDKNILFYVDSTAPEITSITGLDKSVVDATELTISYTVFDAIGLKSVKVYVDGEVLQEVTDFTADYNNYAGSFTLEESEKEREIRVVVEDMAGNITDTASEDFTSAYAFNDGVTVTTNALVRFYANKPLFYGSIGGTAGVAGLAGFGIRHFRLRKKIK